MVAFVIDGEARDHRVGGDVARGLDGGHQVDDRETEDRGEIEADAPLEWLGDVEGQERARLEGHHVEAEEGDQVADDDAEDDRPHAQVLVRRAVEEDDRQEHRAGNREVLPARERERRIRRHRTVAAAARDDADLDESEADQRDNDARDKRGDDRAELLEEERRDHLRGSRADAAAEDERESVGHARRRSALGDGRVLGDQADADERTDELEARTLHAEQLRADGSESLALDEGADAGSEERHRDQKALHLQVVDLQAARDEQRRCDDGDEDCEQVLERREEGREERRFLLDAVDESRVLAREEADQVDKTGGLLRRDHAVRPDLDQSLEERVAVRIGLRKRLHQPDQRGRLIVIDLAFGDDQDLHRVQHLLKRPPLLCIHRRHLIFLRFRTLHQGVFRGKDQRQHVHDPVDALEVSGAGVPAAARSAQMPSVQRMDCSRFLMLSLMSFTASP